MKTILTATASFLLGTILTLEMCDQETKKFIEKLTEYDKKSIAYAFKGGYFQARVNTVYQRDLEMCFKKDSANYMKFLFIK